MVDPELVIATQALFGSTYVSMNGVIKHTSCHGWAKQRDSYLQTDTTIPRGSKRDQSRYTMPNSYFLDNSNNVQHFNDRSIA